MRFLMATASCVVLAAMIAGCSNSSHAISALPGAPGLTQSSGNHPGAIIWGKPQFPQGPMTTEKMMKWFAAGKMLGPLPASQMKGLLARRRHQTSFRIRPNKTGKVGMWVANLGPGTLLGQTAKGNVNVTTVSPKDHGCDQSMTVKTYSKNLWDTCGETFPGSKYYDTGGVQEYSERGRLEATYNGGCPTNIPASQCEEFYGYGYDNFENAGYVFSANVYFENAYDCYAGPYGGYYCEYGYGTGWEYWPKGGTSDQPTEINIYDDDVGGFSIFEAGYSDIDNSGDIYGYAYACNGSYSICGTGIIEVADATGGSPTVTWALTPGTLPGSNNGYWAGVYISNKGTVLNVNDSYTSDIYRYKLPVTQSSVPFQTLGPIPGPGSCTAGALAGGFSKGDKRFAEGNGGGNECAAIDVTKVKSNDTTVATGGGLSYPVDAAYVKADK
jgi:hypothetical protein